jgi:FKBP-type peptidyl-prolyl cis-trans isomerase
MRFPFGSHRLVLIEFGLSLSLKNVPHERTLIFRTQGLHRHSGLCLFLICLFLLAACSPRTITGTTDSGFPYVLYGKHNGPNPKVGDKIRWYETATLGRDTTLYTLVREGVLPSADQVHGPAPNYEMMFLLTPGDSATTFITGEDMSAYFLSPTDTLYYHIGLHKIIESNKERDKVPSDRRLHREAAIRDRKPSVEALTRHVMAQYLDGSLENILQRTATGFGYIIHKQGTGHPIGWPEKISVHYFGWILPEGVLYAETFSDGIARCILADHADEIPGAVEGFVQLRRGAQATFIIPAALANDRAEANLLNEGQELLIYIEVY